MKKFLLLLGLFAAEAPLVVGQDAAGGSCIGKGTPNMLLQFYRASDTTATGLVATATTDTYGRWDVNLPGTGNYRIYSPTQRLWLDRFSWVENYGYGIDAKFYGAKGDGTTNDRVAIQKAINSLPILNADTAGTIYLPGGIFSIKDSLLIREGVRLMGAGERATIISLDDSLAKLVTENFGRNIEIANLTIRINALRVKFGIDIHRSNLVKLHNLKIASTVSDTGLVGIRLRSGNTGGYWNTVEDCDFDICGNQTIKQVGILFDSAANENVIRNNKFACWETGIFVSGGDNQRIEYNDISGSKTGILLRDSTKLIEDVLMLGNRFENDDVAIRIRPLIPGNSDIVRTMIIGGWFGVDTNLVDSVNRVQADWNTYWFAPMPGDQSTEVGGLRGVYNIDQLRKLTGDSLLNIRIGAIVADTIKLGRTNHHVQILDTLLASYIKGYRESGGNNRLFLKGAATDNGIHLLDSTMIGSPINGTLRLRSAGGRDLRLGWDASENGQISLTSGDLILDAPNQRWLDVQSKAKFSDSLQVLSGANGQTDSVLVLNNGAVAGGDSVLVNNTRVSGGSLILVTPLAQTVGTLFVKNRGAGRFTIVSNADETGNVPVVYYIAKF